jgi:CRISPR/Cas system-associated endonuclease/helicase Cas3
MGKALSEIRAELHVVGNWSDKQETEEISFHLGHWWGNILRKNSQMLHQINAWWKILKNVFEFTHKSNTDLNQRRNTLLKRVLFLTRFSLSFLVITGANWA